ncbi:MAG: 3-deoxy-D-manno-octulosonic acid transferase [Winogradskyella sp.]|nr:3-deoxy-D-manno-octulosonic acid transferase [Winogradskyella sp.]
MKLFYNLGIYLASLLVKLLALFNDKLKKGVTGRADTFQILDSNINRDDKTIWFHCASLGEYEQGLPVFKAIRKQYRNHNILLTFFSPSGYEIRKNANVADIVAYLPLDTPNNAKRFLDLVHPELIVFVKYDVWPNYLEVIKKRKYRAILISALLRKDHIYFKWYGKFMRQALFGFEHIFVQDQGSKALLESINYHSVTVSGDTRFDRVSAQLSLDNTIPEIKSFKDDKLCIVFGSTWPEDDHLIINYIHTSSVEDIKYIIAPHSINNIYINELKHKIEGEVCLFSDSLSVMKGASVLIINNIGLLSKIYSYADIAYVGGAMGKTGLHNILEPAVFGVPIIIGPRYHNFPEAIALVQRGGVVSIHDNESFEQLMTHLISSMEARQEKGHINKSFVEENKGALIQILDYIRI